MANSDRGRPRRSSFGRGGFRGGFGGGLRGGLCGAREEVDEQDELNDEFEGRRCAGNGRRGSSGRNSNDPSDSLISQAGIDRMMAGMFSGELGSQAHLDWLYRSGYDTFPRFGIVTPLPAPALPAPPFPPGRYGPRPQDQQGAGRPRRPSSPPRGDRGYGGRGCAQRPGNRGGRGVRFADDYGEPGGRAGPSGPSRVRGRGRTSMPGGYPRSPGPRGRGGMSGRSDSFEDEYDSEDDEFYEDQPPRRGRSSFSGPNGMPRGGYGIPPGRSGMPRSARGGRGRYPIGGRGVRGEVYEEGDYEDEEDEGGFFWYGRGTDKKGTINYEFR